MTIQQPTELTNAAMLGLGVHRPERVVTNDEICEVLDSSDEWIQTRSGIRTRRFAGAEETLIGMSTAAAERALAAAGVRADQVGCVIVATSTHPEHTPASAPQVATALGITAAAFDISAGCAGFCHALNLAASMVRSGAESYVLVIGAEQLSRFMDPTDRGTAFIFADGAGAVVVGPSEEAGIGPTAWGSDGSQAHVITQTPSCLGGHGTSTADHPVVQMEGTAVFRWAPFAMAEVAQLETLLREKQLELDQLLDNAKPNQARVDGVRGDMARLQTQIDGLRQRMTSGENGNLSLARITGQLRIAETELQTRQAMLAQALQQQETARIEANRQVRYLSTSVAPIAPDEATYPKAFENTALAFMIFAGIYLMLSLTASILREQVTA